MKTPRIEEMVENFMRTKGDRKKLRSDLAELITQVYQAGIDEAVVIVENIEITKKVIYKAEEDYERGMKIGYNDGIYIAKRDILKALQDNK